MGRELVQYDTPGTYQWTVPSGVTSVDVAVQAPGGGSATGGPNSLGSLVSCTLTVTPGEVLTLYVGEQGQQSADGVTGGVGGTGASAGGTGGAGYATYNRAGAGGGGASGIKSSSGWLVVAGAGGGDGAYGSVNGSGGTGANGEGQNGAAGQNGGNSTNFTGGTGGGGATASTNGAPGTGYNPASGATGGASPNGFGGAGGGGGGGWYVGGGGGSGGGNSSEGAGGGGGGSGSSYGPSGATFQSATSSSGYINLSYNYYTVPPAPSLQLPRNGGSVDATANIEFEAQFNQTDNGVVNAYALRIKLSNASSYLYFNASTGALQSTIVWNPISTEEMIVVIPANLLTNGNTYNWSMAAQEQGQNYQSQFANDYTITTVTGPSVTITAPIGNVPTAYPTVNWTAVPPATSSVSAWQVVVESYDSTHTPGVVPGSGAPLWNSGVQSTTTTYANGETVYGTWSAPQPYTYGVKYRAFVQILDVDAVASPWVFSDFTPVFDRAATPSLVAAPGNDPLSGEPIAQLVVTGASNLFSYADSSFEGSLGGTGVAKNGNCVASLYEGSLAEDGSYAMRMSALAVGSNVGPVGALSGMATASTHYAVVPGQTYTVWADYRALSLRESVRTDLLFTDASDNVLQATHGSVAFDTTSGYVTSTCTDVAPENAAYAYAVYFVLDVQAAPQTPPAAPSVSPQGTSGSTPWYYVIVAHNVYGSVASAEGSTQSGTATLSSSNYNALSWGAMPGATSYDVYRGTAAGKEDVLVVSGLTGTSYNDTGGGTNASPPATNTTGESHLVDQAGLFPGRPSSWTRGGLSGAQTFQVQYSTDGVTWSSTPDALSTPQPQIVRFAESLTPDPTTQVATAADYEIGPGGQTWYRAQMSVTLSDGEVVTSVWSDPVPVTPNFAVPTGWWLKDPLTPSSGINVSVGPTWEAIQNETLGVYRLLGRRFAVVIADTVGGQDAQIQVVCIGTPQYLALLDLFIEGKVLLLQSPFGQQWYIRHSTKLGTERSNYGATFTAKLNFSGVEQAYYAVQFDYVEVDRP